MHTSLAVMILSSVYAWCKEALTTMLELELLKVL